MSVWLVPAHSHKRQCPSRDFLQNIWLHLFMEYIRVNWRRRGSFCISITVSMGDWI